MKISNGLLVIALSTLLTACGGSGGSSGGGFISAAHAALPPLCQTGTSPLAQLGGYVDHNSIFVSTYGDWAEVMPNCWRVGRTPIPGEYNKITVFAHARSGTGGCDSRLYNKLRIVRVSPNYKADIGIDSEALIELSSGCLRFFDASRTVVVIDRDPVPNVPNIYAVEAVAGDSVHFEISYGSDFMVEKF